MGRAPCCEKVGLNRGAWTTEEDNRLMEHILNYGHSNWRQLPKQAGLLRCGKSCRLRWINYLRPDIKRGNFTREEEEKIIQLHGMLGNKWSHIASCLPGRTDNEIKNVWNTHIKKKLRKSQEHNRLSTNKLEESTSSTSSVSSSISCTEKLHMTKDENDFENPNNQTHYPNMEDDELNIHIPMDPAELWDILEDGCATLHNQVLMLDANQVSSNSTNMPGEMKPTWLAELEQALDLWGTTGAEDGIHQQQENVCFETAGDDPVCSYFQILPHQPSNFDLFT